MSQSRKHSAIESVANVASGFLVSWAVWVWIASPLFDMPSTVSQSFGITCLFTVSSLLRSYAWRRIFNRLT